MKLFKIKYSTLLTSIFILNIHISFAQTGIQITTSPLHMMNCLSQCTTLVANFPKPNKTNIYNVSNIAYSPNVINGTTLSIADDKFSNAINIGFPFCFYEDVYTQCFLSDNGTLTFNPIYANGNCNNNTQQTLPYFNSTFPDNAIFFLFMDINPNLGGTISYTTTGNAPFRKFIVNYQNVRLFGNTCNNNTSSFQVVLYETTNIIDVFITNKTLCDLNNNNYANFATVGIQNIGCTSFMVAPAKHAAIFTSSNEAIRFAPAGAPNYSTTWYNKINTIIATNIDSINFCPIEYPYNKVKVKLQLYCPNQIYWDSVTIDKVQPVINNIQVVQPFCLNDTNGSILVNATVNAPPATYAINNGPFTPINFFNNLISATYTVTVKDNNGCSISTLVTVSPLNVMTTITDSIYNPVCPDTLAWISIQATGTQGPYNILWSNGQIGNLCTNIGAMGVYATITDAIGCTQIFPFLPLQIGLPIISFVHTKPVCKDSSGIIIANVTGGSPPYTYYWNNGAITPSISNIPSGLYVVSVTDINGCLKDTSFFLSDTLNILTSKVTTNTKCGLNNGYASVTPLTGLAPFTYSWSPGGQNTNSINNLAAGTYICTITAANNCTKKDTFIINPSLPIINNISFTHPNCDSNNGAIYLNTVQNFTTGYTIQWSNGQTGNQLLSGINTGMYWVKTQDSVGCVDIDTVYLQNEGKPELTLLSYKPPLCNGMPTGEAQFGGIKGTAPYKFSLDGITYSSDAILSNILAGVYTIYISDANSCTQSTTISFSDPPLLDMTYTTDTIICFEDKNAKIQFSVFGGTPPYVYSINNGLYSTDTLHYNMGAGIYVVVVKDKYNCSRTFNIQVPGPPEPLEVTSKINNLYCYEDKTGSASIDIDGGWKPYKVLWSNGDTTLELNNLSQSNFTVQITDHMGCVRQEIISIDKDVCCQMEVPNAFTPNKDGLNDAISPIAISMIKSMKFSIYNRWGQRVFYTESLNEKWDGTLKEIPCNMDTYFYMLEYTCPKENKKYFKKGDITLIR